jgi:hypothetical protein
VTVPAIIEMRLHASRDYRSTTRQLHGLACAMFEGGIFTAGQHTGQEKPFSIWPLEKTRGGWNLRCAWLLPGLPHSVLSACGQLRLGPVTYTVTDLALRPASHAELADTAPVNEVSVSFRSPAYFSQDGTGIIEPDPRLIVGSWRRRWNASVPTEDLLIGDEQWAVLRQSVRLTGLDVRTAKRDNGYGIVRTGLSGTIVLRTSRNTPEETRRFFGGLARFAEFCGTGAQTTHGFGATALTATMR